MSQTPAGPDDITRIRSLIVGDRQTAIDLSIAGVSATTYDDLLGQPDRSVIGYLRDEVGVAVVKNAADERKAAAVAARLGRLLIPVRIVRPDRQP